ncbi:MAG: cytochrome c [Nitrosomonadales bacterium]|nr:cytochrome c [Nitrosomonadales bacterium]
MKKLSLAVALLLTPALAQAWPWSQDMANQLSVKPQESPDSANPEPQSFPKRSVPVPGTTVAVKDMEAAVKMANPIPADEKSIAKGAQLFNIYCVPCHGKSGTGDGYVGAKLILRPFDLTSDQLAEKPDGHIFGMMTFGGAIMPPYAYDLSPTERWHVVNYVRKGLKKASAAQAASSAK